MNRNRWLLAAGVVLVCTRNAAAQSVSVSSSGRVQSEPAASVTAAVLTPEQAVREALDHNLALLAERFNVSTAKAAEVTASLKPNPVLTVSALRPNQSLIDAGVSPSEEAFRADYVIEGGGKRQRRIDHATLATSVAELDLLNTSRQLVLDVENAFVDVQLAKLNLALAQQNLSAFNDLVAIDTERVEAGDLSGVELSRSQLAAFQFQNDVEQQQARLRVARNRLSLLMGRGASGDAIDVTGELRREAEPASIDTVRALALERRPDLQAARQEQARSTADLRLQLANGRIDYTISGEYHRQHGPSLSGNEVGVFFSIPLPVFNRNQGEIARARTEQEQLATRTRAVETEIGTEVVNAYTDYLAARGVVERAERDMLTRADTVRSTTEYSYRRGEASLVEFLDAVRAFNDTMQSYNGARADYARSLYALDSISGQVNP